MILLGKTLEIFRGDSFALDYEVFRENKVPYVLQKDWQNPYILLQVRSGEFLEKNKGTVLNFWIDLSSYPKFVSREPEFLEGTTAPTQPPSKAADACIYYIVNEDGERKYYYWTGSQWKEYHFKFVKTFYNHDTKDMIQSTWWYEISLVTGQLTQEFLLTLLAKLGYEGELVYDNFWLLDQVCKLDCTYKNVVNPAQPLTHYIVVNTLQKQHKLVVR